MQEEKDIVLSWDALGRMKAQAEAWQESFTQKCSRTLRQVLWGMRNCAQRVQSWKIFYILSWIWKKGLWHWPRMPWMERT